MSYVGVFSFESYFKQVNDYFDHKLIPNFPEKSN